MFQSIRVSVIIPVCNGTDYLTRCLESVCNQTLENIEVLCIADSSADDSVSILQSFSRRYSFVKIIEQPATTGIGAAFNAGLEQAQGEYIAFLDAQGIYCQRETLQNVYACAKAQNAKICGGGIRYADGFIRRNPLIRNLEFDKNQWIAYRDYQECLYYPCFLFQRAFILQNNIRFPLSPRSQHLSFLFNAMLSATSFYAMAEPVYSCYFSNQQCVNDMLCSIQEVLQLCREHRLGKLYRATIQKCLSDECMLKETEASLIQENDFVVTFYQELLKNLDTELLAGQPKVDLQYAKRIASWNGRRNLSYVPHPIPSIDSQKANLTVPKVSVVIPVYNTSRYLKECLDSILSQTLSDIEVICIDDGSTDDSGSMLDAYAQADSRVRVIHQHNQGIAASRNTGMQHVRGSYVYFMDSDDILATNAFEELLTFAEERNTDIVFFGAESFFDEQFLSTRKTNYKGTLVYSRKAHYPWVASGQEMLVSLSKNDEYYCPIWIQFFRTDFLRNHQLSYFVGIQHEDELFSMMAILLAKRVACLDRMYFKRRIRSNSIMTSKIAYDNLLGGYLTTVEIIRHLGHINPDLEAYDAVISYSERLIRSSVCERWYSLSRADRVLFLASLTDVDRSMFDILVMPTSPVEQKICKKRQKEYWMLKKAKTFVRIVKRQGFKKALLQARKVVCQIRPSFPKRTNH